MSYQEQIEQIVTIYNGSLEAHQEEVRNFLKDGVKEVGRVDQSILMQEIKDQLNVMKEQFMEQSTNLNNRLQVLVESIRGEVLPADEVERSADHAAKVANAITFIKMEGENLTDEITHSILKDFRDDLDTMQLFKRMIGKYVDLEDMNGTSMFPRTFGTLNVQSYLLNVIKEMEGITAYLFAEPLNNTGETYTIYNNNYSVPGLPPFKQVEGEQLIVKLAKELDDYHE